jgi:RNA polymerase sigma factor (sigma-70 family)
METVMNDNPNVTVISSHPAGDHAIALAAKRGDERAFGILFERYQPKIFAVALRYTGVSEDAEDIVQQTFRKAFIHLHAFAGKSSFSTWLTRIAINEALMLLRRARTLREVPIDDSGENETFTHGLEIPDSGLNPEANYLKREETEALSAAVNKLKVELRTAIELRELGELSTQETARRMSLSVGAVKARVFHGRRKLRKTLRHLRITARGAQPLTVARLANRSRSRVRRQSRRIASNVGSRCEPTGRADWKD